MITLASCSCGYNDIASEFVIIEVQDKEAMETMSTYRVQMNDDSGIGNTNFWFTDEKGKYKKGDKIMFMPNETELKQVYTKSQLK